MAFNERLFVMKKFSSSSSVTQAMGNRWRIPSQIPLQSLFFLLCRTVTFHKLLWFKGYSTQDTLWLPQAQSLGLAVSAEVP